MFPIARWLFNPFPGLPVRPALVAGLLFLLVSALLAAALDFRFPGTLNISTGFDVFEQDVGFGQALGDLLIDVGLLSLLLGVAGRFLGEAFRPLALVAYQMLARWPMHLGALVISLLPGLPELTRELATLPPSELAQGLDGGDMALIFGVSAIALVSVAWSAVLMYRAYHASCPMPYRRGLFSYFVALFASAFLSTLLIHALTGG